MGRTMRRGDSSLNYLPTQYICDFVMSIEDDNGQRVFDGIEYQSAMRDNGAKASIPLGLYKRERPPYGGLFVLCFDLIVLCIKQFR